MVLFDEKRNIRPVVSIVAGGAGAALGLLPLYFELHQFLVVGGLLIGVSLVAGASLALRSATLDLRAFTNDPLGWRNAKKSYQAGVEMPEETNPSEVSD